MTSDKNIVILISGKGSNMAAIVKAASTQNWQQSLGARIACVISNRPAAEGLAVATGLDIATRVVDHGQFASRGEFDAALREAIDEHRPALVVLAGFMRILTPAFVAHYAGRLVNIHPSLLPAFPGLDTYQRALNAGCKVAGATVHQVTVDVDHGPILAQAVVPVIAGDTASTLAARVLTQEHLIYPQAIGELLRRNCAWIQSAGKAVLKAAAWIFWFRLIADVYQSNGVIHVVDKVLLPK